MSYLRVVHRWDPLSALLGASPGAMAQVISLASELGGDLRAIAIVQTVRVLLIVVGLPNGLALFGLDRAVGAGGAGARRSRAAGRNDSPGSGGDGLRPGLHAAALSRRAVVRRHGRLGDLAWHRISFTPVLPWWIGSASVITLGALVGSRFANTTLRMLVGYLGAALGSFAVAMAVATLFILIVAHLFAFPDRQYRHRVLARRAGYDDGARAGAASRSGLCRRASPGAFSGGYDFGGNRGARVAGQKRKPHDWKDRS